MHRSIFRSISSVLSLLGFFSLESTAASGNDTPPVSLTYESAGKRIGVDLFAPAGSYSFRTIIALHGAAGMSADMPRTRQFARSLNENGNTVYAINYFDRTDTTRASEPEMEAHFAEWLQTVRDGIAWVHHREGKQQPIGIYGYSLGAFLAVAASSDDARIGAVVEQAGGLWNSQEGRVRKMPPVLMVHGEMDKLIGFEDYAKPLLHVLKQRGGEVETDFVPGEGHVFSEAAMKSVSSKAANFFARKLPRG